MELKPNCNPYNEDEYLMPSKFVLIPATNRLPFFNMAKSLVIYIGLGYLLLKRWDLLLVILGVLLLHEAGHFFAMKYFRYSDVTMLFLPFIGAFVKGTKKEISQKQSIIILLAGPLPGFVLGLLLYVFDTGKNLAFFGDISLQLVAQLLIWTNLLNLLPVYPLDGGQLVNRVYFDDEGLSSDILFFISMAIIALFAIVLKFYLLLVFPAFLIYKFFKNRTNSKVDKAIDDAGIDVSVSYEELTGENYWALRNLLILHHPAYCNFNQAPPFIYNANEHKIASEIEAILSSRILLLDASLRIKIIVAIVLIAAIALPFVLGVKFMLFQYFIQ